LRTTLFRLAYEGLIRRLRTRVGPHRRVTKTGAKSAGRTKMTRSLRTRLMSGVVIFIARRAIERSVAGDVARIALCNSRRRVSGRQIRIGRAMTRSESRVGEISLSIALRL
jgi:hypothetical protein